MAGNTFGTLFRVTTFGESHGAAIGCIVDGCPAGLLFDLDYIQHQLARRRPGQSSIVTQRKESDTVQVLSGVFEGRTTGTPIGLMIPNEDQRSRDYDHLAEAFRPSHADYTWQAKYGYRDHRGGGRSSARETAARVAAGAIAKLFLKTQGVDIQAYVSQVGHLATTSDYMQLDLTLTETNDIRCPDPALAEKMIQLIKKVRKAGDTIGGVVSAVVRGCPVGLGEPVFDKLHADLGKAMLSINAAKGFEYGSGFEGVKMLGSEHNDLFSPPLPPHGGGELDSGGAEGLPNFMDSFGPPLPPRRGGELDSGGAEYPTNLIEPDSGGAAGRGVIGSPPLRGGGGGATLPRGGVLVCGGAEYTTNIVEAFSPPLT
ncbi:MAG: chorismate synthase, partial [Saprospiraceae bacterium]|nr:chorismate synthase [Saprospiraceae bacterium]